MEQKKSADLNYRREQFDKKDRKKSVWNCGRGAAGLLTMAFLLQPFPVLAGPASDITAPSGGNGPAGSGSSPQSAVAGSHQTTGFTGGVSAVTSGLGTYVPTEEFGIGAIARGIDVSYWQQNIDWSQVASDNVQFAMLATRFRGNVDPFFSPNADGASRNGIRLGAYIYSYATSVEMAQQEADFVLNLIKDYPISFPVVFDAEDAGSLGTLTPAQVSDVINAFCSRIRDAGYYPMVYANEYWIQNKIDMSRLNYDIWVAKYNERYTYQNPAMWQCRNTGSVKGISGNVDIDYLYKDFTQVIPADTWRTIGGRRYYYKNHVMQKNAWAYDGQNWYYMNGEGQPSVGWLESGGHRFYLESDGRMATGWKELDGSWRYFDPSGELAIGWRLVNGNWYHLDGDGRMQTGWIDVDGKRYWLESSGVMVTGWKDVDGNRYYFDGSGSMATGWQAVDGNWYYMGSDGRMQTGWIEVNGNRYYLEASGNMATGWKDVDGKRYYLDPASGAMAAGGVISVDGVAYQAAADGVCTPILPEENGSGQEGGTEAAQ